MCWEGDREGKENKRQTQGDEAKGTDAFQFRCVSFALLGVKSSRREAEEGGLLKTGEQIDGFCWEPQFARVSVPCQAALSSDQNRTPPNRNVKEKRGGSMRQKKKCVYKRRARKES